MTPDAVQRSIRLLCTHLSAAAPARQVSFESLRRKRRVPSLKQLGWGPDYCVERGAQVYLVHVLSRPEIPPWVKKSQRSLRTKANTHIIVVSVSTKEYNSVKLAEQVSEACAASGFGLLCESSFGLVSVLPPRRIKHNACGISGTEIGHIPKWIIARLLACETFSPYLQNQLRRFEKSYRSVTNRTRPQMYDREADVLEDFLRRIRNGARPFYLTIDRFLELKNWEREGAHHGARDHYFHTFNNLLLGLLILAEKFSNREHTVPPDSFISSAEFVGRLKPWELLWFLTCLNHDPGYTGEKIWPSLYSRFGLRQGARTRRAIPAELAEDLSNGWETDLKEARRDLLDLYRRVSNAWVPPQAVAAANAPFDEALRIAYFDGERTSHSLLSGLTLIQGFSKDPTQSGRPEPQRIQCLAACEIAALSMLFHDQRCRELLQARGVPPIPFEQLPYASLLIFADALQDDRRDISVDRWSSHGVLNGLTVLQGGALIRASVCLRELSVKYWPSKLVEYDSALRWLNSSSQVTFEIDFRPRIAV